MQYTSTEESRCPWLDCVKSDDPTWPRRSTVPEHIRNNDLLYALFSVLTANASNIGGESIVRGAIPLLKLRLKLDANEAIHGLLQLEKLSCISRKDEWRCISIVPCLPVTETLIQSPEEAPVQTADDLPIVTDSPTIETGALVSITTEIESAPEQTQPVEQDLLFDLRRSLEKLAEGTQTLANLLTNDGTGKSKL